MTSLIREIIAQIIYMRIERLVGFGMNALKSPEIDQTTVRILSEIVHLKLREERIKEIIPFLRDELALLEKMDELELGEAEFDLIFRP